MDRAMDRDIGDTWWFGHSNKRNKRIGKKGTGQRTSKMECADVSIQREPEVRGLFRGMHRMSRVQTPPSRRCSHLSQLFTTAEHKCRH